MSSADENRETAPASLPASWALSVALAALAIVLRPQLGDARAIPSASVLALLFGLAAGTIPAVRARFAKSASAVAKSAIPIAIVLIGFGLDLEPLFASGSIAGSVGVVVIAMAVAFAGALLAGRIFGLDARTSLLLGAGTAVCGNSAILAVAPTVQPDDEDLGLTIGVINLLGVAMLFALPPIANALGVTGAAGGALSGLTVHAVPQAIATGEAFGDEGVQWATLFKLMRVAMLVPLVVMLAFVLARVRGGREDGAGARAGMPLFAVLFVVAAALRASGWFDAVVGGGDAEKPLWSWLSQGGRYLLAVALAAIGLTLRPVALLRVGPRVLAVGLAAVAIMVAVTIPLARWLFA
ncbi:MAG: putative sulfate exporter family transporter [Planctomycetota bacterium]